jgi:catechol 2,3-dioxygenase-like lactoylglutathione lyase family enzyme
VAALAEVSRFLHCNSNCRDVSGLEHWYAELFGLKAVMRSRMTDTDGRPFGLQMPFATDTTFLYDHRGARVAISNEIVQWHDPPTIGVAYPEPWMYGIQSIAYQVPDLDTTLPRLAELGGRVVRRVGAAALVKDPEDVNVEIVAGPVDHPEAHHLRLVVSDLGRSRDWYEAIGFTASDAHPGFPSAELWDGGEDHQLVDEVALAGRDERTFALVLTRWSGPLPLGPPYISPNHQGIYRMAVAVDDVWEAYEALWAAGVVRQPPYTFPMPDTPLAQGLTILFLRDPDGVVVELVHRPRSTFKS